MSYMPVVQPRQVGVVSDWINRAHERLRSDSDSGVILRSSLCVSRRGGLLEPRHYGTTGTSLFSVASLTKPVVAAGVMILVDRGTLSLDDRASEFMPGLAENGKGGIRVRHLLNHTSGLPDQLPENVGLRTKHSPLSAFLEGTCRHPLLFPPGSRTRYQSMGFVLLGEIVRVVTGKTLAHHLSDEIFHPLGMADTFLGCPEEALPRIVPNQLEPGMEQTNWHWNTPYWLQLEAPWGGLVSTASDLARFCQLMLDEGSAGKRRLLSPAAVRAMMSNQLQSLPDISESEIRSRPWGLGWRLQGVGHSPSLGDLLSPRAVGHTGATGCLMWVDPVANASMVLLTSLPQGDDGRHLVRISNIVASAFV